MTNLAEPQPTPADPSTLRTRIEHILDWLDQRIVGQSALNRRLVQALICGGHVLVEGAPGLAKTRAIKDLSFCIAGDFHRIQFTPDLLPSDVTGTEIYRPENGTFQFQQGPIFHNLVLADEVNRAPPKVQSALLEAMAEHQVSVGRQTFRLPELFFVMATQNPLEQEGTFPLPEAQLDRFLLHIEVPFPAADAELDILRLVRRETANEARAVRDGIVGVPGGELATPQPLGSSDLASARHMLTELHMSEAVERYLVELVLATRSSTSTAGPTGVAELLVCGVSPRATMALDLLARAEAFLDGRDWVGPDDVRAVCADALRHRLLPSDLAYADGLTANDLVQRLLDEVPVA